MLLQIIKINSGYDIEFRNGVTQAQLEPGVRNQLFILADTFHPAESTVPIVIKLFIHRCPLAYFHQIFLPRLTAADGWSEDLLFSREHPAESVRRIGAMAEVFASLAHLTLETIEDFRRDGEVSLTRFSDGTTLLVDIANRKMELKR